MATCPDGHESVAADYCDICGMRIGAPAATGSGSGSGSGTGGLPSGDPSSRSGAPCPRCGAPDLERFCEACGYQLGSDPAPAPGPTPTPDQVAVGEPAAATGAESPAAGTEASPAGAEAGAASVAGAAGVAGTATGVAGTATGVAGTATGVAGTATGVAGTATGTAADPAGLAKTADPPTAGPAAWTAIVSASRSYFDSVIAEHGPDSEAVQFPAFCPERRYQLVAPQMRIGRRSISRGLNPEIDLSGPPADPGISRLHAILVAQPDGGWAIVDPGSENGTMVNDTVIGTDVLVPLADGDHVFLGAWTAMAIVCDPSPAGP
jgi:hypothetical protein